MFRSKDNQNSKFFDITIGNEKIDGYSFEECEFKNCRFIEVDFTDCNFVDSKFSDCTLSAVKATDTNFSGLEFKNSKIIGCNFTGLQNAQDITIKNSDISISNFRYLDLSNFTLIDSKAHETNFVGSNLEKAKLTGNDFLDTVFHQTNLEDSDFTDSTNYLIDPIVNKIKNATFSFPAAIGLIKPLPIKLI